MQNNIHPIKFSHQYQKFFDTCSSTRKEDLPSFNQIDKKAHFHRSQTCSTKLYTQFHVLRSTTANASANIFTSDLANMFASDLANIFTSDLANMFTSELEKCQKNDLANLFPSEVDGEYIGLVPGIWHLIPKLINNVPVF